MNTRSIEVVGTFQGCWTHWVGQLIQNGPTQVHKSPLASQDLAAMLRRCPDSNVLVLVEHPAVGLAHLLGRSEDIDPETWLDEWLAHARTLLAHAQQNPDTTLVVNADEVLRRPHRLGQLLQARWGELFTMPSRVAETAPPPDVLIHALAWSFIERDPALQDMVPELMATCAILPGLRSATTRLAPEGVVDGVEAARRLAELMQIEQRLAQVTSDREFERDALRCELQTAADRCAQLSTAVQALEAGHDRMMARTDAADHAVVEAQSRLEAEVCERNALAAQFAQVASRQESTAYQLTVERENAAALGRQIDEGRAALAHAEEQWGKIEQELAQVTEQRSTLEGELERTKEAARAAGDESDRLLQQLNQVQDQLEQSSLRNLDTESALLIAKEHLAQATERRSSLEQELTQAREERSAFERELDTAKEAARTDGEEAGLLLQQLHQVQEELERSFLGKRDNERALLTAKEDLTEAVKQRSTLEQELTQIKKQRGTLERELATAKEAGRVAGEDVNLLRQKLSQLQQDLEQRSLGKHDAERALLATKESLAQAEKQRDSLQQKAIEASKQRTTLEQELASTKEAVRAAGEEGDLLLQQLHQVQEELERMFLAKRDAENALLDAKTLEQDLRSAREECELLTLQTRQLQQELERVHAEKVQLTHEVKSKVALPGLNDVAIGEVAVAGERDTPPHREVSFVVREVRAGERHVAEAAVRLVEHWGRPGLVIFADEGRTALFETWRESGREDGRPYMLLVHGDASSQLVYDSMGTLDWQLVQALAVRLGQAVQEQGGNLSPAWRSLAQRLLTSLQEQPARLRYENVVVTSIEREPTENLRFALALERASFHGRTWQRLPIQWQPNGSMPSLDLESDEESGPPLLAWPADAEGAPVRALRLPLGDDPDAQDIHAIWDLLTGSDRAFVAELLNLMPIIAMHLQAATASTDNSAQQVDLQAAATGTMLFGRSALQPARGEGPQVERRRPLLERMARRLGATAKALSATDAAAEPALDR